MLSTSHLHAQSRIPPEVLTIFENSCAYSGCHMGRRAPRGLDLTEDRAYGNLVGVESSTKPQFLLVKPGDPDKSYIIKKLLGADDISGEQMPKGNEPLPPEQIQVITDWIRSLGPEPAPKSAEKVEPPKPRRRTAFPGVTVANLPTPQTPARGGFVYRISHRFRSPVRDGFDRLFGLDGGAYMMTQMGLPLSDNLYFTLARSAINATFELAGKWRFWQQMDSGWPPISAALVAGVAWATLKQVPDPSAPNGAFLPRTAGERFSLFAQLPVSKVLGDRLSLLLVPGILFNGNVSMTDEKPLVTLGVAGRWEMNRKYGLFVEWVPILSGAEDAAVVGGPRIEDGMRMLNDTFSVGMEIAVGGHVFHVFVTNSGGNTTNQYLSGGNFDFVDGEFRLGFNIYRHLDFPF
ncbi:MAG: DUF5777 family beta-barrel protein [candidate division KSB1 bacterium]|nr:DUF5777 family beta-barrel protein [candidate division KSB1 bacterium]